MSEAVKVLKSDGAIIGAVVDGYFYAMLGLLGKSPNGKFWKIEVNNTGNLTSTEVSITTPTLDGGAL